MRNVLYSRYSTEMQRSEIRAAVERVDARPVVVPGKRRGYVELALHYQARKLFRVAVSGQLPDSLQGLLLPEQDVSDPATEVLALGQPSAMDHWAPDIARWRDEGVTWEAIVGRTGLDLNRAFIAWRRYTNATRSACV